MKTATKSSIFSIIEKSSRTARVAKNLESMLDIVLNIFVRVPGFQDPGPTQLRNTKC